MVPAGQRKRSVIFVVALGVVLIAVAVALNITWVVSNWRSAGLLVLGVLSFMVLIGGLSLNTIFLVREIRRNEQHDAFINAVTHELKTPLASIRLYLQTLQQRDLDRAKQQEFIDIMLADGERLQSTIDQVLLAGSTGGSRRPMNRSDVDLVEMVRESMRLVGNRHHWTTGELELAGGLPEGEQAVVWGDPDELKAAIMNLLDNAVKYSGDRIKVFVNIVKTGARKVSVQVKDEGIGIGEDELKRVFRRFYRIPGRSTARVKGTGLGLSIVHAVAKRHGGRAYVESEGEGRGSRFSIELPLKVQ
ncbi:MAG: HAMP domain-containing sensor histidine kinase [Bryobacterales bacterium]